MTCSLSTRTRRTTANGSLAARRPQRTDGRPNGRSGFRTCCCPAQVSCNGTTSLMCGICGELRFDGAPVSEARLVAMRDQLVHRGPDSDGVYVAGAASGGLGFRRLRIIDLTANASQPMANENGSVWVVFNGEIYNFQELREGLVARGHRFRSQSDTETIVHLYEEKGADCIGDLDGMFAIAIWDERAGRMTLARDRAGKKPLFYYRDDRMIAFASEIKAFFGHPAIPIEPDPEAVPYYFIYGYVPLPATIYTGILQLE